MSAPRIIAKDYSGAIRFARETLGLHPNTVRVVTSAGGLAGYGYTLHLAPGWKKNHAIHSINSRLRFKRGIEVIDHEAEVEKEPTRKVEDAPSPFGEIVEGGCPTCGDDAYADADPDSNILHCANDACPDYDPATFEVAPPVAPEEEPVEMRHCDGCGEDYDALSESHVGHEPAPHAEVAVLEHNVDPEETDDPTGTSEPSEDAESAEKPVQRRRRRCKKCGELVEPDDVEAHAAQHEEE